MEYNVGIIDDDSTKITQLITYISLGWNDEDGHLLKEKYKDFSLNPLEVQLEDDINEMVEKIMADKPDALIIDFKLSSQENISYSGVALAKAVDDRLRGFPIFILTSFEDDLYEKESFDAYQVFDFARYITEDKERIEIRACLINRNRLYHFNKITIEAI